MNKGAKFLNCSEYTTNWSHSGHPNKIWLWWLDRKNCDVMSFSPGRATSKYVHPKLGTMLFLLHANSVCACFRCVGSGDPSGRRWENI